MTDYTTTLFDSDFEEHEYMIEKQRKEQRAQAAVYAVQPVIHWQSISPFSPALGQRVLLTVGGTAREGYRVTEGQFRTMDGSTHTGVTHWSEMPAGYSPAEEVRHE